MSDSPHFITKILAGVFLAAASFWVILIDFTIADSNMLWQQKQHDLWVARTNGGDVLMAQDNLNEALTYHRLSLGIAEQLVATDPSNTEWQRDLSVSYKKVGDVLARQGKLEDARKAHRDSLVIAERLGATDRSNDLSAPYNNVGNVLAAPAPQTRASSSPR